MFNRKNEDEANRRIRLKIAEKRIEKGLTQAELATDIQKSQKNLSDLETGRTQISASDLMYIASQLQTPVRYFLPVNYPEPEITDEEWQLIFDYRRMWHRENRDLARKLFKEIADRETAKDIEKHRREYDEERVKQGKKPLHKR